MASDAHAAEVKEMIQSFYKLAGIPPWDGDVNENVAAVFGTMLSETRNCSKAFAWVPQPPAGKASVFWLVTNLGRGVFNIYRPKLSVTCARAVIYKWGRQLDMASLGLALGSLPKWA
jgi:hypothetical protein